MNTWTEWILASLIVPLALLAIKKRFNRKKEHAELTNLYLDTRIKINDLAERRIRELEEREKELEEKLKDIADESNKKLEDCTKSMQEQHEKLLSEIKKLKGE